MSLHPNLRIRESLDVLNGNYKTTHIPSGEMQIISDDERIIFSIYLHKDASLEVRTCGAIKHDGKILGSAIMIRPISANCVVINREKYE